MNRKALVAAGGVVVLIMIVAWVGWIARILFWGARSADDSATTLDQSSGAVTTGDERDGRAASLRGSGSTTATSGSSSTTRTGLQLKQPVPLRVAMPDRYAQDDAWRTWVASLSGELAVRVEIVPIDTSSPTAYADAVQASFGAAEPLYDVVLADARRLEPLSGQIIEREYNPTQGRLFVGALREVVEETGMGFLPYGIDMPLVVADPTLLSSGILGASITPSSLKTVILQRGINKGGIVRHFGVLWGLSKELILKSRGDAAYPYPGYLEILGALIADEQRETIGMGKQMGGGGIYRSWSIQVFDTFVKGFGNSDEQCVALPHWCLYQKKKTSMIPTMYSDISAGSEIGETPRPYVVMPLRGDAKSNGQTTASYVRGRVTDKRIDLEKQQAVGLLLDAYIEACFEGEVTTPLLLPACTYAIRQELRDRVQFSSLQSTISDVSIIRTGGRNGTRSVITPGLLGYLSNELSIDEATLGGEKK